MRCEISVSFLKSVAVFHVEVHDLCLFSFVCLFAC